MLIRRPAVGGTLARYLLTLLLLANTAAYAADNQDTEDTSPTHFKSEVGLGFTSLAGNSDSQTLNANYNLEYINGRYKTDADTSLLMAKKNGEEDKRKISTNLKSQMMIRDGYYLYANGSYIDDRYGPYYVDSLVSAGIGYRLFSYETFQTLIDIGPGFRHQDPNLDEIDGDIVKPEVVNEGVLQSSVTMSWKPLKTLTLDNKINVVAGKSNTTIQNDLSVTNSITDNLGLSVGFNYTYYTWVPANMKNFDSSTIVSLIYSM